MKNLILALMSLFVVTPIYAQGDNALSLETYSVTTFEIENRDRLVIRTGGTFGLPIQLHAHRPGGFSSKLLVGNCICSEPYFELNGINAILALGYGWPSNPDSRKVLPLDARVRVDGNKESTVCLGVVDKITDIRPPITDPLKNGWLLKVPVPADGKFRSLRSLVDADKWPKDPAKNGKGFAVFGFIPKGGSNLNILTPSIQAEP